MTEISCVAARSVVSDYIDGDLPDDVARAFERHLKTCRDCVPFYATLLQTVSDLRKVEADFLTTKSSSTREDGDQQWT